MNIDKFDNLTKGQVEALLECFDLLSNGYHERNTIEIGDCWIIQLYHTRNNRKLRVFIQPNRYRIVEGKKLRKMVSFKPSCDRYQLIVNSPKSVGVVRVRGSRDERLVPS